MAWAGAFCASALILAPCLAVACGGKNSSDGVGASGEQSDGGGGVGHGGSGDAGEQPGGRSGAGGNATAGETGSAAGSAGSSGGAGQAGAPAAEQPLLDVFVMIDVSGSTCLDLAGVSPACDASGGDGCGGPVVPESLEPSRLELMTEALTNWVHAEESAGIGVGLGYFGHQCIGQTTCEAVDYATPLVGIGALPQQGAAIEDALGQLLPTGETPTGPALRGACSVAKTWKAAHAARTVVLLLVTDGAPKAEVSCPAGCCPDLPDAVDAALECRDLEGISTYVVGVGPALSGLSDIATAGIGRAYFVTTESEMAPAFDAFRADALVLAALP